MTSYRYAGGKFIVNPDSGEDKQLLLKLEGVSWNPALKQWEVTASHRVLGKFREWKFRPVDRADMMLDPPLVQVPERYGLRRLYPFQREGVAWLKARKRALLYDQQGLGKTTQALAWADGDEYVLVVCPLAVADQWLKEAQGMNPTRAVSLVPRRGLRMEPGVTVTNYERLEKVVLPSKPFTLIVDEATYIKNQKSKRSKTVIAVGNLASKVLALTGTPVVNRPYDLWPMYMLLKQRRPNDFWGWTQRYCAPYQTPYGWDFSGASYLDELADDMRHFALRRERAEVLPDLPPKVYLTISTVQDEDGVNVAVQESGKNLIAAIQGGQSLLSGHGAGALQRFRVDCALAKVDFAADWLAQFWEGGGGKVLVFSTFKEPLSRLGYKFDAHSDSIARRTFLMNGDMDPSEREEELLAWRMAEGPAALLLTYGVGGMGLNLQEASTVLLLDLPWTPAELEQAEDRVHRIGQSNPVQVVTLSSGHWVEDLIEQGLRNKKDVITTLYTGVAGSGLDIAELRL